MKRLTKLVGVLVLTALIFPRASRILGAGCCSSQNQDHSYI